MMEDNLGLSIALMETELSMLLSKKQKLESKIERIEMVISELRKSKK